ncbi:DNA repair protein RecO [Phosphitispora fastidiosa]|uniref:DNA repair protein RecO n=1 Tax=Phosphitispora fastidiosa TaxID=2837202 RepID=UPI001E50C775|nr:DNA repair protein RecO [Phosphitispora fastidiosa]MBU7005874.1 DNA repair protein RecO (recombination protein O) [Phosphitispora fastidiosa]
MKDYQTEGIIIRVRDYGEADRIVTILTSGYGKVQAIAKGCRKPKSRKRGLIQLFTHADFVLYRGRNLDTITQCEGKESFAGIRGDLDRMAYAAYLAEVLDGFAVSGEIQEDLFYLALVCLHLLTVEDPELVTRVFEVRIMRLLGYMPHLDDCVHCGSSLKGSQVAFSSSMGGGLCGICSSTDPEAAVCTLGTLNMLKQLSRWDLKRLRVLRLTAKMKREIGEIMQQYISQRIEKRIRSADFIQSLASVQNKGEFGEY